MTGNTFGHLFRVTTFGESHGPAIGCVVDGVPPHIPLEEADINFIWINVNPANQNSRHNEKKATAFKFYLAFSKE